MAKSFVSNREFGKYGEDLAQKYLVENGHTILERNYHYSKNSEIDIISFKENVVHFVEVKTRSQDFFGSPLEAIDAKKLSSIYNCALYYIKNSKLKYKTFQIDAVGILFKDDKNYEIKFIENISI